MKRVWLPLLLACGCTNLSHRADGDVADLTIEMSDDMSSAADMATPPDLAAPVPMLSLVAGGLGGEGFLDGNGTGARFRGPTNVATDASGNVYAADSRSYVIRKISPQGVVSTLAGADGNQAIVDGTGAAAQFSGPHGVVLDAMGNLFVADATAIRKVTPTGVVTTFAGGPSTSGHTDGNGANASFNGATGITIDSQGNLFVVESLNNLIRKITPNGDVTTFAGSYGTPSFADGNGASARFGSPTGIGADAADNLFVADTINRVVRKITPLADVTTLAGSAGQSGSLDGSGGAARFMSPRGLAVGASGIVYVADDIDQTLRTITPAGDVTTLAGSSGQRGNLDGAGGAARFDSPHDVAVDSSGKLFVADSANSEIRAVTAAGSVTTFAGAAVQIGSTEGAATQARFASPTGVALDSAGSLFVADFGNATVRKITSAGVVSTLAGYAGTPGNVDASSAAARFDGPYALATDATGNVYVADTNNHAIRKITPGGAVTTLATMSIMIPTGVAVDASGNVFVTDRSNVVLKITPSGTVSVLAGSIGAAGSSDGFGSAARFREPFGVAGDSGGALFVADSGNQTIREVSPAGSVTTFAGAANQDGNVDGTGAAARFSTPAAIAIDAGGNLFVVDEGNRTIRKITPAAAVTTLAGRSDQQGVAVGPLPGAFNDPISVTVGPDGAIYVADDNENAILKIH